MPDNDIINSSVLTQNKFDFSSDPTYVEDGFKYIRYWFMKYAKGTYYGYLGSVSLFGGVTYAGLKYKYITQCDIIDYLQFIHPYSNTVIHLASTTNFWEIWLLTMQANLFPMLGLSLLYGKIHGTIWEYYKLKERESELKENISNKNKGLYKSDQIDTLTLKKNKISDINLIYEIQLIKKREKKRSTQLAPITDVVDIKATFSIANLENTSTMNRSITPKSIADNTFKLRGLIKNHGLNRGLGIWLGTGQSSMDPRIVGTHQKYGLLKLQTRLDEFGRIIPVWQRESVFRMVIPCLCIFLFTPMICDNIWGT